MTLVIQWELWGNDAFNRNTDTSRWPMFGKTQSPSVIVYDIMLEDAGDKAVFNMITTCVYYISANKKIKDLKKCKEPPAGNGCIIHLKRTSREN